MYFKAFYELLNSVVKNCLNYLSQRSFGGTIGSSHRHTVSLICRFSVGSCQFDNGFRKIKYSFDQLLQKWLVSFWQRFSFCSIVISKRDSGGSDKAVNGFPIRKWPGVSTSIPPESSGRGISSFEFRHTYIFVKVVVNSL